MTPNFFNMSAPIESENDPDTLSDEVKKRSWMIRSEDDYKEEYLGTIDLKSRLSHYYYGRSREDYDQLRKCLHQLWKVSSALALGQNPKKTNDYKRWLIEYESKTREERLAASANNDVWEYRTEPPEDWNQPLLDFMREKKGTPLDYYQDLWQRKEFQPSEDKSFGCSIS